MAIKENDFLNVLKLIAPGTEIREGLDNILKAKTGALIVIGEINYQKDQCKKMKIVFLYTEIQKREFFIMIS